MYTWLSLIVILIFRFIHYYRKRLTIFLASMVLDFVRLMNLTGDVNKNWIRQIYYKHEVPINTSGTVNTYINIKNGVLFQKWFIKIWFVASNKQLVQLLEDEIGLNESCNAFFEKGCYIFAVEKFYFSTKYSLLPNCLRTQCCPEAEETF